MKSNSNTYLLLFLTLCDKFCTYGNSFSLKLGYVKKHFSLCWFLCNKYIHHNARALNIQVLRAMRSVNIFLILQFAMLVLKKIMTCGENYHLIDDPIHIQAQDNGLQLVVCRPMYDLLYDQSLCIPCNKFYLGTKEYYKSTSSNHLTNPEFFGGWGGEG